MQPTLNAEVNSMPEKHDLDKNRNKSNLSNVSRRHEAIVRSNSLKQRLISLLIKLAEFQNPFIDLEYFELSEKYKNEWVLVNCWAINGIGQNKTKNISIGDIGTKNGLLNVGGWSIILQSYFLNFKMSIAIII